MKRADMQDEGPSVFEWSALTEKVEVGMEQERALERIASMEVSELVAAWKKPPEWMRDEWTDLLGDGIASRHSEALSVFTEELRFGSGIKREVAFRKALAMTRSNKASREEILQLAFESDGPRMVLLAIETSVVLDLPVLDSKAVERFVNAEDSQLSTAAVHYIFKFFSDSETQEALIRRCLKSEGPETVVLGCWLAAEGKRTEFDEVLSSLSRSQNDLVSDAAADALKVIGGKMPLGFFQNPF